VSISWVWSRKPLKYSPMRNSSRTSCITERKQLLKLMEQCDAYSTGPPFRGAAIPGVRVRVRVNPSGPPEWWTGIMHTCYCLSSIRSWPSVQRYGWMSGMHTTDSISRATLTRQWIIPNTSRPGHGCLHKSCRCILDCNQKSLRECMAQQMTQFHHVIDEHVSWAVHKDVQTAVPEDEMPHHQAVCEV